MGRVEDKVAFLTGAARGQGRSHAVRLAAEGADIIAIDRCADVLTAAHDGGTEDDLAETERLVKMLGRRIVTRRADVRDQDALDAAVADGLAEFGRLDIVVANAGIASFGSVLEITDEAWQEMIDINLTGVWHTIRAAAPAMISLDMGGSVILTSSVAGLIGYANQAHYVAAKHGVVGLMRALSVELAPHSIRVNSVHPSAVNTPMLANEAVYRVFRPDLEHPTADDVAPGLMAFNALPTPWLEPSDVSDAVLYLASDESRYVTGTTTVIDAGSRHPAKIPHWAPGPAPNRTGLSG